MEQKWLLRSQRLGTGSLSVVSLLPVKGDDHSACLPLFIVWMNYYFKICKIIHRC